MDLENIFIQAYILLAIAIALPVICKILTFYILRRMNRLVAKSYNKTNTELDDLLNYKQVATHAKKAKEMFHDLMKAGELSHEQILYLIKLINRCLGVYSNDYIKTKFTNEAHEIYTKLSSTHLSISNLIEIIHVLELFRNNNIIELKQVK